MKGTGIFVSGVVGGIVALVWGGACFIGGCAFMYKLDPRNTVKNERKDKMNVKPHLEEVK